MNHLPEVGQGEPARPNSSALKTQGKPDQGQSRTAVAVEIITALSESAGPGERLGSKQQLRAQCGVSVGTLNEAIRLLESRGLITVRSGPGGGVFAATQSAIVRLGNSFLALDATDASTSVAEAVRLRDILDPATVEDALWHASPAAIADMRREIVSMGVAVSNDDPTAFVRANWHLHARIASVSPNGLLRSLYLSLLDIVESHTLSILPSRVQPLPDYVSERHQLHAALVEAIAERDQDRARELIQLHATTARYDHHSPASE